jgi:catechol 2,3-dioxygenase
MNQQQIHPDVTIGHVHLRVADLERAMAFYRDVMGMNVVVDGRAYHLPMILLAAGDYHHHVAINTFESKDSTPPPAGHTGLYHFALLYPDREALADAVQRLVDHDYPMEAGRDHGATVSVYLQDPDGNGIELYYDRPRETWFDANGRPTMQNTWFDPKTLLLEPNLS